MWKDDNSVWFATPDLYEHNLSGMSNEVYDGHPQTDSEISEQKKVKGKQGGNEERRGEGGGGLKMGFGRVGRV